MKSGSFNENKMNLCPDGKSIYELIFNSVSDIVVLYEVLDGPEFRFFKVNHVFQEFYGLSEGQVHGRLIRDVIPACMASAWHQNDTEAVRSGKECTKRVVIEGFGEFETRYIPVFNQGKCTHLLVTAQDLSEKRQLEREISHLDRLNAVGEMAAAIGHEIRNPMTTVKGFLQLMANRETDPDKKEHFLLMIQELDKANSIITEYLSLAKNKLIDLKPNSIDQVVRKLIPLLKANAAISDKTVRTKLGKVRRVFLDEREISQLVINLVNNGLEAMAPGGCVTVSTLMHNDDVVLTIGDQGPGINPKVLEKLGTPFNTDKENGIGLGLAVCYSIAARHNAAISVKTGETGTVFYVRFKSM